MPIQIAFYDKDGNRADLIQLDAEMREHFGIEPNPNNWLCGWMDSLGLYVAIGWDFPKIRAHFEAHNLDGLVQITDYLTDRYTSDAYRCLK